MPKTVLVIEDDPFLRKACETKLAASGFGVLFAQDGASGLEIARSKRPDLILLDLAMPGKSGFDVLVELRQDPDQKLREMPVIVLTNLSEQSDQERAMGLGASEYLVKSDTSISHIIERILARLGGKI